ncbi:MAG: gliding motility-associated C-terminal domain-containing protein [Lewinellaceae bacterium]|nr:gliding motility-associated C-terminal domain-containing protein [Saprospiraceae bacterium]MCB9338285.1 gliding motility-associated C-terminal domain-containing protein [Lewinellaceae bacterium]
MKTPHSIAALFLLTLFAWACKDDGTNNPNPEPEPEVPNIYKACCGAQAVEEAIGQGHVYIPNIFTPNSDGINDILLINADDKIAEIEEWVVKDTAGNTVFEYYSFFPNRFEYGWLPDESEAPGGLYTYEARIKDTAGLLKTVSGSVCVYRCKTATDSILMENIARCQFGVQHDGAGGYDPNSALLEPDSCF